MKHIITLVFLINLIEKRKKKNKNKNKKTNKSKSREYMQNVICAC